MNKLLLTALISTFCASISFASTVTCSITENGQSTSQNQEVNLDNPLNSLEFDFSPFQIEILTNRKTKAITSLEIYDETTLTEYPIMRDQYSGAASVTGDNPVQFACSVSK